MSREGNAETIQRGDEQKCSAVVRELLFFEVKQKGDVGFPFSVCVGRTQSYVYLQPGLQ